MTTIHPHLPLPHIPETLPESSSSISSAIYSCHATQQPHSCPSTIAPTASRSYPLRYQPPSQELGSFVASALCLPPNDMCLCRCLSIFSGCSVASAALLINHHPGPRSGTRSWLERPGGSRCASALCSSLRCTAAGLRRLAQKLRTSLPPLALACGDQTSDDDDDDATQLCTSPPPLNLNFASGWMPLRGSAPAAPSTSLFEMRDIRRQGLGPRPKFTNILQAALSDQPCRA